METGDSSNRLDVRKRRKSGTAQGDAVEGNDIISHLPESLLQYILSFLPTTDVVRMSVLSTRWRYFWASMPYLNINWSDISDDLQLRKHKDVEDQGEKFAEFVNWVLIMRDEAAIQKFRLSCECFYYCIPIVYRWIHYVVKRNVQELDITCIPDGPEPAFSLPRSLFSCESLSYFKLDLKGRVLNLPTPMGGFSRLITLSLKEIHFSDEGLALQLLSNCPLLENLCLIDCLFEVIDISAANLKNLTIVSNHNYVNPKIKLCAPNLLSFKYEGCIASSYSLHNLSSLSEVFVDLENTRDIYHRYERGYPVTKLLRGLYNVKVLTLSLIGLEDLASVVDISSQIPTFYNLKSLKLLSGVDECYFKVIAHLVACSPNLEDLDIEITERFRMKQDRKWKNVEYMCVMHKLKTIEISDIGGGLNELDFIKFLLKNGKVLDKMVITWSQCVKKHMKITRKLLTFPRASSTLEISFPDKRINEFISTILFDIFMPLTR